MISPRTHRLEPSDDGEKVGVKRQGALLQCYEQKGASARSPSCQRLSFHRRDREHGSCAQASGCACMRRRLGGCGAGAPTAAPSSPVCAVSPFLAWIGSPCLRHCVHGASIGGGGGAPPRHSSTGRAGSSRSSGSGTDRRGGGGGRPSRPLLQQHGGGARRPATSTQVADRMIMHILGPQMRRDARTAGR
jgi:hypothetical protein